MQSYQNIKILKLLPVDDPNPKASSAIPLYVCQFGSFGFAWPDFGFAADSGRASERKEITTRIDHLSIGLSRTAAICSSSRSLARTDAFLQLFTRDRLDGLDGNG